MQCPGGGILNLLVCMPSSAAAVRLNELFGVEVVKSILVTKTQY